MINKRVLNILVLPSHFFKYSKRQLVDYKTTIFKFKF